jgi:hypothetical protein
MFRIAPVLDFHYMQSRKKGSPDLSLLHDGPSRNSLSHNNNEGAPRPTPILDAHIELIATPLMDQKSWAEGEDEAV